MSEHTVRRVVAVNRGLEPTTAGPPAHRPEHRALERWIGRWITTGNVLSAAGVPAEAITASDVYEWAPGGFHVVHTAFGHIGEQAVGGVEIISFDLETGTYRSWFHDSQGNTVVSRLRAEDNVWTYTGTGTRATVEFSGEGRVQRVLHERRDEGGRPRPLDACHAHQGVGSVTAPQRPTRGLPFVGGVPVPPTLER